MARQVGGVICHFVGESMAGDNAETPEIRRLRTLEDGHIRLMRSQEELRDAIRTSSMAMVDWGSFDYNSEMGVLGDMIARLDKMEASYQTWSSKNEGKVKSVKRGMTSRTKPTLPKPLVVQEVSFEEKRMIMYEAFKKRGVQIEPESSPTIICPFQEMVNKEVIDEVQGESLVESRGGEAVAEEEQSLVCSMQGKVVKEDVSDGSCNKMDSVMLVRVPKPTRFKKRNSNLQPERLDDTLQTFIFSLKFKQDEMLMIHAMRMNFAWLKFYCKSDSDFRELGELRKVCSQEGERDIVIGETEVLSTTPYMEGPILCLSKLEVDRQRIEVEYNKELRAILSQEGRIDVGTGVFNHDQICSNKILGEIVHSSVQKAESNLCQTGSYIDGLNLDTWIKKQIEERKRCGSSLVDDTYIKLNHQSWFTWWLYEFLEQHLCELGLIEDGELEHKQELRSIPFEEGGIDARAWVLPSDQICPTKELVLIGKPMLNGAVSSLLKGCYGSIKGDLTPYLVDDTLMELRSIPFEEGGNDAGAWMLTSDQICPSKVLVFILKPRLKKTKSSLLKGCVYVKVLNVDAWSKTKHQEMGFKSLKEVVLHNLYSRELAKLEPTSKLLGACSTNGGSTQEAKECWNKVSQEVAYAKPSPTHKETRKSDVPSSSYAQNSFCSFACFSSSLLHGHGLESLLARGHESKEELRHPFLVQDKAMFLIDQMNARRVVGWSVQ